MVAHGAPGASLVPRALRRSAAGARVVSRRQEVVLWWDRSGRLKSPIPPASTSRGLSAKACVLPWRLEHEDRNQHHWDNGTAKAAPAVLDQPRYAGDCGDVQDRVVGGHEPAAEPFALLEPWNSADVPTRPAGEVADDHREVDPVNHRERGVVIPRLATSLAIDRSETSQVQDACRQRPHARCVRHRDPGEGLIEDMCARRHSSQSRPWASSASTGGQRGPEALLHGKSVSPVPERTVRRQGFDGRRREAGVASC